MELLVHHILVEWYFLTIVNRMIIWQISNRSMEPIIKLTSDNSGETIDARTMVGYIVGSMLIRMLGGNAYNLGNFQISGLTAVEYLQSTGMYSF